MNSQTIALELEPGLVDQIDQVANLEFKGRSDVIREAIVSHVHQVMELADLKRIAAQKYLDEELSFDQLGRIVGYENAIQVREGKKVLVNSIRAAKEDSKRNE